ncbi:MAG: RNA methyltransferase [Actinomyces urogenitalis]|uniref:RNA methyltransferase, TrmH family n=5 Tax=Actinomyces urogenitalis TaxID=103621 RepID=C0W340_9ACTO|nr:RNA methyltransferase [Actinomyces urogenitalis]EEH66852.1 RNA methyltransferase, TrmH family [Actinomyces urogenitalis DSM 15434]KGF04815.1 rRNA methyltransferase [Actinomyces urogenitalis S6-C4]MBS5976265.1 RNA methyltransferase [Actinomyces urogenitalis]MBS6071651.1 RNA methyltransferase [Actinomyces urogenitalis]MCI7457195.1 RNA methyltransferase [Actinomyces urogenitalis]
MIIELDDVDDPRLADYTSLTDVALRRRLETERGLYMAESSKVIVRAVEAGHAPRSFLMAPRWYDELRPVIAAATGCQGRDDGGGVPVFIAPEPLLESITGFHLHRGALAAMNRPALPSVGELLASARGGAGARRVAVLEDLVDHTNVGAAFRSAAALGIDAVLVTPHCADPLYRRSVRVSMGTVFQVPWTRIDHWPALDELHAGGFTVAALALSEDSVSLGEFSASPACSGADSRVAVVLGTEGDGLAPRTIAAADAVVRIPMAGAVDSLNVAAAAAVAFWELRVRS